MRTSVSILFQSNIRNNIKAIHLICVSFAANKIAILYVMFTITLSLLLTDQPTYIGEFIMHIFHTSSQP